MIDLASAYTQFAPALRRYLRRYVGESVADDLLGDVFVGALERAPSYQERGYSLLVTARDCFQVRVRLR